MLNDLSQPTPQPLSVSLVMTPAMYSSLQREQGAVTIAEAYEIDSSEMAVEANTELQSVKSRIKQVKEWKAGFVEPAKQIIANAESLFDPALDSLTKAEHTLKSGLMNWQHKEAKRIEDARRAQEEIERRARQKAEQEAAAARAKAEQYAAEARRKAQEAEAARARAEAEGNAAAARAAAAAAAKQAEKAEAAIENGELKAQQAEMAAAAAVAAPAELAPAKLAGFSTRDNWVAELAAPAEADAIKAIGAALATRPELIAMLKLDMTAANKLAKALKDQFNVPGLKSTNKPVAASRG
jgi:hypothetical protein